MWKAKVEISYRDLNHLGHKSYTWTPASPATSPYLPLLLLLFFFLMLVNRHLQKVLFTADEAHCASHPSRARAERTRPNPSKTPPLGPPLLSPPLLSSCGGAVRALFRSNGRQMCAVGLTSLRCHWRRTKRKFWISFPHLSSCTMRDRLR